jgi:hypothetical protein
MARGKFIVDRSLLAHPAFEDRRNPRWCRRAAFLDLLSLAAWAPRQVSICGKTVTLQRGELSHSFRFLAKRWSWSESAVRRFFDRLISDALIDAVTDAPTDAGQTMIRIRNYEDMQRFEKSSDAPKDAHSDAEATQNRRKEEHQERKEMKRETASVVLGRERPQASRAKGGFAVNRSAAVSQQVFEISEELRLKAANEEAVKVVTDALEVSLLEYRSSASDQREIEKILGDDPAENARLAIAALMSLTAKSSKMPRITSPIAWIEGAIANQRQAPSAPQGELDAPF